MQRSNAQFIVSDTKQKNEKRIKLKIKDRILFGVIRPNSNEEKLDPKMTNNSINSILKKGRKKKRKEGNFNTGRWLEDEHQRFIEALLKFGNDWKNVQRYVGSRSSTQARSHAQKFFVKIGKTQIENLSLDFENNSLKSLNLMANNLNQEQMSNAIKHLNEMAFEKKTMGKRQINTENFVDFNFNENSFDMDNMIIELNYNKIPKLCENIYDNCVSLKNKTLTAIKRKKSRNKTNLKLKGLQNKLKDSERHFILEDVQLKNNRQIEANGNDDNLNFIKNFNTANNMNHRKNSTDFSYPFNFINDNSIFLNAAMNFFKKPLEEKDFQIIFDKSFNTTKEIHEEDFESEIIFFERANSSSQTKSNNESRKNSSEDIIYGCTLNSHRDIIDEFLDCS